MKYLTFTICLTLAVCTTGFAGGNYAVLMQESPAGAGEIQPGPGVHTFGVNEKVTLNTVPKKGYKFVYWLGDVSDPTTNRTTMSVDGPKIIIAVFERDAYELPSMDGAISQGPESLTPRNDLFGGDLPSISPPPSPPSPPDGPKPPDNPVPEPGTMILLASGIFILRKRFFGKQRFLK
ncbi:MAG: PEP-CTERM sorting domain-containing protein [Phycisphaerae bacterium]